jgi:hypothetical protein
LYNSDLKKLLVHAAVSASTLAAALACLATLFAAIIVINFHNSHPLHKKFICLRSLKAKSFPLKVWLSKYLSFQIIGCFSLKYCFSNKEKMI